MSTRRSILGFPKFFGPELIELKRTNTITTSVEATIIGITGIFMQPLGPESYYTAKTQHSVYR
jgi:hypothetical protein